MYKWSLLLLASAAVFQPIASFTESNLVDGRQQCCDHQPHLLHRDNKRAAYGNYRINKVASEDRLLNDQRDVTANRQYEIRSFDTVSSRETESPNFRRFIAGHSIRLSGEDRRATESRDQRSRDVSRNRFNWVSGQKERNYRDSRSRVSRDTARVGNDHRLQSHLPMDSRREQRLFTRETTNMRNSRLSGEARDELQRARNDVAQANIRNRRISREAEFLNRRNNAAFSEPRQNLKDNNREYREFERVRDGSEARLPSARSRMQDENRRQTRDNSMREVNLNHRVARESLDERMNSRQTLESRRVTDNRRAGVLNERDHIRKNFRQERRVASADRKFANTVEREVRMRTRPESTERNHERQSRRIREDIREYNDRDTQRSDAEANRRFVRSDRSFTRDADVERRQVTRSLDRRSNMAFTSSETRRSLLSRDESRNMKQNRNQNTRYNIRDTREAERRSVDRQETRVRYFSPANTEVQRSSEDRIMSRRISRDAFLQSRNVERRITSFAENNRRFIDQSVRSDVRMNERLEEDRRTTDRRMDRSRYEARLVENVRAERQEQSFDSRPDMRTQSASRFNERSGLLLRQSRELERDNRRTRDARINEKRETRKEERSTPTAADTRDRSETRSRLTLAESARFRREYVSKKSMDQESFALNWQYLFYTLQGIYLCGVIATMMKEKHSHKSRSWWGISTKAAVKVD